MYCLPHQGALMMEAVCTSETSVNFKGTTQHYIPEDSELHTCCRENLKSHTFRILTVKLKAMFLFAFNILHLSTNSVLLFLTSLQIWGCEKSGLFHAFSKHILHRLKIPLLKRSDKKIHVTLLSRDTTYRRILNEKELIEGLQKNPDYVVKRVRMSLLNYILKFVF
jgi:hypothetical protein